MALASCDQILRGPKEIPVYKNYLKSYFGTKHRSYSHFLYKYNLDHQPKCFVSMNIV